MDINEAFRRIVVGHLRLTAVFVVLPVLAVLGLSATAKPGYVASARIQASTTSIASDTEADSVLNRVIGVATSTAIVRQALQAAKIDNRSAEAVTREITVTRLGSSTVMDIAVTDSNGAVATSLASSLATTVVNFLGSQGDQQPQELVDKLTLEQRQLTDQRDRLVAALSQGTGAATAANLSPLSSVDAQLTDVGATLRQLLVAIATGSSANVISLANPATAVPTNVATDLVLAVLAGLIAGLLFASILEVIRPRVADARAFAREVGVPVLGSLSSPPSAVHRLGTRLSMRRRRPSRAEVGDDGQARAVVDERTVVALRQAAAISSAHSLVLIEDGEPASSIALAHTMTALLRAPVREVTASNDHTPELGSNGHASGFSNYPGSTLLRAPTDGLRAGIEGSDLRVLTMSELDADFAARGPAVHDCALLVVVAKLTRYSYLQHVGDLAAATRWPVLGVLETPTPAGKRRS